MGSGREFIIFQLFLFPSFVLFHFHNKILSYLFCHWKVWISLAFFMNRVNRGDTKVGLNHLGKLAKDDGVIFNALHVSRGLVPLYQDDARMRKKNSFNASYIEVSKDHSFKHTPQLFTVHSPATLLGTTSSAFRHAGAMKTTSWGSTWASELTVNKLNMVVGGRPAVILLEFSPHHNHLQGLTQIVAKRSNIQQLYSYIWL